MIVLAHKLEAHRAAPPIRGGCCKTLVKPTLLQASKCEGRGTDGRLGVLSPRHIAGQADAGGTPGRPVPEPEAHVLRVRPCPHLACHQVRKVSERAL